MALFSNLIERTITRLSMVGGLGTQLYAEDAIAEMIQHKFDVLFDERFWPQFCSWQTWTLDGTLGVVTTDVSSLLKRFDDIDTIFRGGTERKLLKFPGTQVNATRMTGTTPRFYAAYPSTTKVFNIFPVTSTGTINVHIRTKPDTFTSEDDVNFDDQALILGATYDYLEDDGTNPQATEKFRLLFEARVGQLKRMFNSGAIPLDARTQSTNIDWVEV